MVVLQTGGERQNWLSDVISQHSTISVTVFDTSFFTDLVGVLEQANGECDVRILTDSNTIGELRKQFFTTAHLEDHIEAGVVEIREQEATLPPLIITDDAVKTITGFPDGSKAMMETSEQSFHEATTEDFADSFETASEVSLRLPGFSTMMSTLEKSFNDAVVEDFETPLSEAKDPQSPSISIDSVILALLVGGYHELSFYDISRWGEDSGLASKAKFSREKQQLENEGFVEIEQIPVPVGRPRHRLLLGDAVDGMESIEDVIAAAIED